MNLEALRKRVLEDAHLKIPKDELFLAKIIQNAGALNLVSCHSKRFADAQGREVAKNDPTLRQCCAQGAALLSPDTSKIFYRMNGNERWDLVNGNDSSCYRYTPGRNTYEIGQAFYNARRPTKIRSRRSGKVRR